MNLVAEHGFFARRRAAWLWLAGLAGVLLVATIVYAQIGSGNRGITPINSSADFSVEGIEVDVIGKDADDARKKGWEEAQRKGWVALYQRMNQTSGSPGLSDSALDQIVSAIVVEQEQIGPRRYIARLGILFDRVRAGQILGVSGTKLRSPPLLVLPVYSIDGLTQVFETRSAWQRAWAEYRTADSSIDYVRTAGTGADTLLLNAGQPTRRSRVWWRVILDQYGAADVLVPVARVHYAYPGGPIIGEFSARFGPDDRLIGSFQMRAPSAKALPDMMKKAVARIDQIYSDALAAGTLRADSSLVLEKAIDEDELTDEVTDDSEDADDTASPNALPAEVDSSVAVDAPQGAATYSVQYSSPDVASVAAIERTVRGIPGVQSAATNSLALGGMSVMRVTFRGDISALRQALASRGFAVQEGGGQLRIKQ